MATECNKICFCRQPCQLVQIYGVSKTDSFSIIRIIRTLRMERRVGWFELSDTSLIPRIFYWNTSCLRLMQNHFDSNQFVRRCHIITNCAVTMVYLISNDFVNSVTNKFTIYFRPLFTNRLTDFRTTLYNRIGISKRPMKYSIECFRKFYTPEFKVHAEVIGKEKATRRLQCNVRVWVLRFL
jgi:hypothetical protein